jgi:hypothetical protein
VWDEYEEPAKTVAQERRERRERNKHREAERKRAEHLAGLSDTERAQFLADEQAKQVEDAAAREREQEALREEWAKRRRIENEKQAKRAREGVLSIWQVVRDYELKESSRQEFLAREEVHRLAAFKREDLVVTARIAMERDDGELLLASWLVTAQEREERTRQQALDPANKLKRPASKLY